MEFLIKLLRWILNYSYKKPKPTPEETQADAILSEHQAAMDNELKERMIAEFKSTAVPEQGAIDYGEMKWESYTRVVETPDQFTFYSGANVARVIRKNELSDARQQAALRRVVRRNVADSELRES